jgi:monoamine oxidase
MRGIDRRRFLTLSAAAAVPLAAGRCRRTPAPAVDTLVIGAGLAGLRTAELLQQAGQTVIVLEARPFAGGRVRTIRSPLDEELYGEAGAIRVPDMHTRVRAIASRFGLSLIPFESGNGAALLRIGDRSVRLPEGITSLGGALNVRADERGLSPRALLLKYVGELPAGISDPDLPLQAYAQWAAIDAETWPAWLQSRGASSAAVTIMTAGGDSRELSALYVLRQFALLKDVRQYFKIDGGMDQLPLRLAAALASSVRYDAPVVSIGQARDGVVVDFLENRARRTVHGRRLVVAVPFSTLREIEVRPALTAEKARFVAELPYFPATRILLQTRTRFWHAEGLSGTGRSDQPAETWDAAYDQPAERGLLAATVGGALGDELAQLTPESAAARGARIVATMFPQAQTTFEKGVAALWAREPYSRGAFAVFHPGQMSAMMPELARADGRVHFAGEHTSPWMGWMEGALESAERAANEVLKAS